MVWGCTGKKVQGSDPEGKLPHQEWQRNQPVGIHGAWDEETGGWGAPRYNWHCQLGGTVERGGVQGAFWLSSSKKQEGSEPGVSGGRNKRPAIDLASPRAGALRKTRPGSLLGIVVMTG